MAYAYLRTKLGPGNAEEHRAMDGDRRHGNRRSGLRHRRLLCRAAGNHGGRAGHLVRDLGRGTDRGEKFLTRLSFWLAFTHAPHLSWPATAGHPGDISL